MLEPEWGLLFGEGMKCLRIGGRTTKWNAHEAQNGGLSKQFLVFCSTFLSAFLSFAQSRNTLARHLAPDLLGATTCLELKIESLFVVIHFVGFAITLPLDTHHVSTRDWILRQDMRLSGMPLAAEWFWRFFSAL